MSGPGRLTIKRILYGAEHERRRPLPAPARILPSIRNLLAEPTWSVRSLLPPDALSSDSASKGGVFQDKKSAEQEISKEKLHHLLRLSALPLPETELEERKLLTSLERHLHFVRAVQEVDTSKPSTWDTPRANPTDPVASKVWDSSPGANNDEVEPLVVIRDETFEAIRETTVHLRDVWPALQQEEKKELNNKVRRKWKVNTDWDALDSDMARARDGEENVTGTPEGQQPSTEDNQTTLLLHLEAEEKHREALAEKRDWWIDVDRLGNGTESRKKGKFFFVRKGRKPKESKTD